MTGRTISHYQIVEKLGEGGMGVVYKAQDVKLDRPLALKFLAEHLVREEEGRQRFVREAKAAAALDHSSRGPWPRGGVAASICRCRVPAASQALPAAFPAA